MTTLADVKARQPSWFSRENKRFFGDVNYWILHDKARKPYLLRSTYAWSDMSGPRTLHYRIQPIDPSTLKIGELITKVFYSRDTAKEYIKSLPIE